MVHRFIAWAVSSPLVVILTALALAAFGAYAFLTVNVEAYPDPAPAIIEVIAQYPGASAEEVERQVTIPLEVALAGMPGLKYTRTKSIFGLCHMHNQFEYGVDYYKARQEVINRLGMVQGLPPGVTAQVSPYSAIGELMRYAIRCPKDPLGRDIYTLNDLKALQDYTIERTLRRVPRIIDVSGFGGTVKRYEIHPDPDKMQQYGLTLQQLQNAIANSNLNVGGDYLAQGPNAVNIRGLGLIGGGQDPMTAPEVIGVELEELKEYLRRDPDLSEDQKARFLAFWTGGKVTPPLSKEEEARQRAIRDEIAPQVAGRAAAYLRAEEERRLRALRETVILSVNNVPVRVENVVAGGPASLGAAPPSEGVVVGHQTRLGQVGLSRRPTPEDDPRLIGKDGWIDDGDIVQAIPLLQVKEQTLPALRGLKEKMKELNDQPGRLLPGVQLVPHFDLTGLIHVTTQTVRENLLMGMFLVTMVLLMFLSNVRSALIVAINIPLALLFAFSVLWLRGQSANLLSIGAVDFGIIVDSSVIMVENIYRHISAGEYPELPFKERILRASSEVERGLFFSTAIMVCAFIPLFTMQGPEGQIFGPMADTYAFALGGALLLALTLSPVLCLLLFRRLKPARDNFLVRWLRRGYLRNLELCLNHRALTLGGFGLFIGVTLFWLLVLPAAKDWAWLKERAPVVGQLPTLGREFMPELEEGNLYVRGTFPVNISLEDVASRADRARAIMRSFPEVAIVQSQVGRPDDGTDPSGFYNAEFSVPLLPEGSWPKTVPQTGVLGWFRTSRPRTKPELTKDMEAALMRELPGVDWNFSQYIRDNVMEALSGVKGDNSVKIIGPDLQELERLAAEVKTRMEKVPGVEDVGVFSIMGQPNLEFPPDPQKCQLFGVGKGDVMNVIQSALAGKALTQMIEGEKAWDITVRWPARLRSSEHAILDIPVDISNNTLTAGYVPSLNQTGLTGPATGVSTVGTSATMPSPTGSQNQATLNNLNLTPRRRLKDLVTPLDASGRPDPGGHFFRPGASTIYREQGNRLIAVKFSVRGRDLGGAVVKAQQKTADLFQGGYRAEWSGEFEEMQAAEGRLMVIIPLAVILVVLLLYLAFRNILDVLVVLSNVAAMSLGGFWALVLTGTNFSISAAVGFISIFGVAIMDGLLSVAYFNARRAHGVQLRQAILEGAGKRVRPMMMTGLTAIFGLLPAAMSTRIGSQTQRPLAIVVVGGMILALLLNRYLMPVLYSFYGHREPPATAAGLTH
jgi:cobalt-zinc-cadmium resistance protein CzcA